jgi:hypothetical protein
MATSDPFPIRLDPTVRLIGRKTNKFVSKPMYTTGQYVLETDEKTEILPLPVIYTVLFSIRLVGLSDRVGSEPRPATMRVPYDRYSIGGNERKTVTDVWRSTCESEHVQSEIARAFSDFADTERVAVCRSVVQAVLIPLSGLSDTRSQSVLR